MVVSNVHEVFHIEANYKKWHICECLYAPGPDMDIDMNCF